MKQTFEVHNVKCGGCANTLTKSLKDEFGSVEVDLSVNPRKITLDIKDNKTEELKLKLRSLGYPLTNDELSGFEKATTTAKSFVSCAIGKIDVALNKKLD
ncbi:MAG TPA: heavy-metal-associated domain-containing protein [Aliarcobacter sp.]|nr:heavy-metal-associated domain-containing protein [Aliarcobacter sp.]